MKGAIFSLGPHANNVGPISQGLRPSYFSHSSPARMLHASPAPVQVPLGWNVLMLKDGRMVEHAGLSRRFAAGLVDMIFVFIIMICIYIVIYPDYLPLLAGGKTAVPPMENRFIYFLGAIYATYFLYNFVSESFMFATPGKSLLHIQVISDDLEHPSTFKIALRNAFKVLYLVFFPVGFIFFLLDCALIHSRGKRLGDIAAHTLVVRPIQVYMAPHFPYSHSIPGSPSPMLPSDVPADQGRLRGI